MYKISYCDNMLKINFFYNNNKKKLRPEQVEKKMDDQSQSLCNISKGI